LETVLESAIDGLEVSHASGTGSLPSLGLLTPVVFPNFGSRVTARAAGAFLDVERASSTTSAQSVRLVVTLAEAGGTLRHLESRIYYLWRKISITVIGNRSLIQNK